MSLDQDEETIYADFDADAYNDLIEYQFSNIVKLMSGLEMWESIQEKVLKDLSANLAALMVMENWSISDRLVTVLHFFTSQAQLHNLPTFL